MRHRRTVIAGLLGAAAIAAVPSAASASANCSYDQATRTMNLRYGAADTNLLVTNGPTLQYSQGGGFLFSCFSTSGVPATAANTDKVVIKAASGTGAAVQTTTIDEHNGRFLESNPKMQFFVFTGTGRDRLIVRETSGADRVRLLNQTGGLAIGPAVDLNYDGQVDVRMTTGFDSIVQVNAGGGADLIDASTASVYQTVQLGEGGNDVLVGGKLGDNLNGGSEDDRIFAKDGVIEAINGGSGIDKATLDLNDQPTSIEQPQF
jgi:Ca2+-binding RTX toxin-like protein